MPVSFTLCFCVPRVFLRGPSAALVAKPQLPESLKTPKKATKSTESLYGAIWGVVRQRRWRVSTTTTPRAHSTYGWEPGALTFANDVACIDDAHDCVNISIIV